MTIAPNERTIFECSREGAPGWRLPDADRPEPSGEPELPSGLARKSPAELPGMSEIEVVRHYTRLSRRSYGIDLGFYPLGSS